MSNFNLRPIPKEIRYKLLQKQKAFSRQSITEATSANKSLELDDDFLNFHNRSTWAHMVGLTVIPGEDEKERIAIIGAGELNQEPAANEPLMKSTFDSIYRPLKDNKNTLYRPISGIKSISTRYEGTLKAARECTVNFTVFSLEDLDRLSPYFFRVGSEVLVEFGWNVVTDTESSMFNTSLGHKIIDIYNEKGVSGIKSDGGVIDLLKNNTAENYEREILKHKGDYEYVYGTIWNFEYSLRDDGGFDCVVKIKTVGMSLLDTKVDREYSPLAISAGTETTDERKIEFTSPDEISDEFYLMMHNLPEIVYGSLMQGYSESDLDPPSEKEERRNNKFPFFGEGIDARDAAWGLMGGWPRGMPTVPGVKSNNQKFVLAILSESLPNGKTFWTKYKPLVSVFQEALLEQGQKLDEFGPDGGYGDETANAAKEFLEKGGTEIIRKFIKEVKLDAEGKLHDNHDFENKKKMLQIITTKGRSEYLFDGGVGQEVQRNYGSEYSKLSTTFLNTGGEKFGFGHHPDRKQFNIKESEVYRTPKSQTLEKEKIVTPSVDSKFYMSKDKKITEVDTTHGYKEKNITIFTSYKQGNTTQIFTGFNWGNTVPGFNKLSKIYAEETYRDNFKPIGEERQKARIKYENSTEEMLWSPHWPVSTLIEDYPDYIPDFLKPEWAKLPRAGEGIEYKASKALDERRGVDSSQATDEFLEWVDTTTVPPQIWIRWGWFEDNILTRYLGYMPDVDAGGSPVSLIKSVEPKINELGEIIAGYESNKIGLPEALKTTDVKQILIPDRVESLEKVNNTAPKGSTDSKYNFNFYASLGKFLGTELKEMSIGIPDDSTARVGISPVEIAGGGTERYKVGYLRNLFVEASTLQQAFLNIGTLKEGLDRFIAIMYKNFGKVHKLEVQQGRDDNMVGIVDTNLISDNAIWKNKRKEDIPDSLENEANKIRVFEFPAWEKESIVKSQDLKVTIPDEMAITALYSANEHMRNFGLYDESRGSAEAQKLSKYLRLDATGKDIAKKSVSNRLTELSPIITSKNLTISGDGKNETGKHRYDQKDAFLTLLNKELLRSIGKNPIHAEPIKLEEVTEEDTSASHTLNIQYMKRKFLNGNGYYNTKGTLEENDPYNMRRIMEYELQYHTNAVQTNYPTINGLLDLSLTIDGTAGIFPGNSYISKYLPKAWQARTTGKGAGEYPILFQATDISHEISTDGWNTTITGMPRMNPKAFPYVTAETPTPSGDEEIIQRPANTAISEYFNFFNLNYEFASQCLTGDSAILEGINTNLWVTDNSGQGETGILKGSFENMGMVNAIKQLTYLGKSEGAMRGGSFESGKANLYANFKKVKELLNYKENKIPGKESGETAPERVLMSFTEFWEKQWFIQDNAFIIPESNFTSTEELLLFLQMSMIICGLTHHGIGGLSIDKAFYNKMLADNNFESNRPGLLSKVGDINISRLISKSEIGEDKKPASEVYFSTMPHGEINIRSDQLATIHIDEKWYYYYEPITPFVWQKKEHYSEDIENSDDVPKGVRLIGPSRFTPEGTRNLPRHKILKGMDTGIYPPTEDLKIVESVFKTILKNEYGIGTWKEFDVIISKALGTPSPEVSVEDLFQNNSDDAPSVDSEKVFKYALDCEYRIRIPR